LKDLSIEWVLVALARQKELEDLSLERLGWQKIGLRGRLGRAYSSFSMR
jgi:hypothetical protein